MVFCKFWNPEETDSNASEGIDVLARQRQADKQQNLASYMSLYRILAKDMAQIKGVSSYGKVPD